MFKILFISCLFFFSSMTAIIYEAKSIEDLAPYILENNTLILFGFDNTVVESKEPLGSKPWRDWVRKEVQSLEEQELLPQVFFAKHLTNLARFAVPLQPIEGEKTVAFFDKLQKEHTPYLFLTQRNQDFIGIVKDGFAKSTMRQLHLSGLEVPEVPGLKLCEGFLFAAEPKGAFVKNFLAENNYFPKRVLFFDNSLVHLQSVESAFNDTEFFGFHFQSKQNNFDPLIASIQLAVFVREDRTPSVEEAAKIAASLEDKDPQKYFRQFSIDFYHMIIEKSFAYMRSL